jgi:hypothetical protein
MDLNRAFEFAVILAWDDLLKVATPCSVRVEYHCEPGTPLDHVTIWLDKAKGYLDRVCDYWTWASPAHATGIRFWRGHSSDRLAEALRFILTHQDGFQRTAAQGTDGLALVYPPPAEECAKAVTWLQGALAQPRAADGTAAREGNGALVGARLRPRFSNLTMN